MTHSSNAHSFILRPVDASARLSLSGELSSGDAQVRLPMVGFTESYNVSVSVALCLDPLLRRLRRSTLDWSLPQVARDELLLAWASRSVQHVDEVEARFAQTYAD